MRLLPSSVLVLACLPGGACSSPQRAPEPQCAADAKIVIGSQADVARAAGCLTIESLTIRTGAALDLAPLKKLHVVLGELRIGPSVGLDELQLPELHSAGSIVIAGNQNLMSVAFPKLATANGIAIEGNVELTTVVMKKLGNVRGDVTIANCDALNLVEMSALAAIDGALVVRKNPQLTLLELGALQRAKAITVEDNVGLPADIVERLRTVSSAP